MTTYVTVEAIKDYLNIAKATIESVSTVDNTFTAVNHGLQNGFKGKFSQSILVSPLSASTDYYVVNSKQNDFQVSTTIGGTAVDLTTTGTGILTFSSSEDDAFIEKLEKQVSAELESRCGRKFLRADCSETFPGGESVYFLANLPVTEIASVSTVIGATTTTISSDTYGFYANGVLYSHSALAIGTSRSQVKISYTGGYAVFPEALESIVTQMVAIRYLKSMKGKGLLVQETMEFAIRKRLTVTEKELWEQAKGFKVC